MAMIESVHIDVSKEFKALEGQVILTNIIKAEGLPTAALILDKARKEMFIYEYQDGEVSVSLKPIEDDNVREQLQAIITKAMERERGE